MSSFKTFSSSQREPHSHYFLLAPINASIEECGLPAQFDQGSSFVCLPFSQHLPPLRVGFILKLASLRFARCLLTPVNKCPHSHLERGKDRLPRVFSSGQEASFPEAHINLPSGCIDPHWPTLPIHKPTADTEVRVDHNPPRLAGWLGSGPLPEVNPSLHPSPVTSQLCDYAPRTQSL